jgi:hypothetical protein
MAWCLIKYRVNLTYIYTLQSLFKVTGMLRNLGGMLTKSVVAPSKIQSLYVNGITEFFLESSACVLLYLNSNEGTNTKTSSVEALR